MKEAENVNVVVNRQITLWKLNVQGVILEVDTPVIRVREAITIAGFDPEHGWQIFLKIAGQSKQERGLDDEIDLRLPGIEKLRLTPKDVNNGEAPIAPRISFQLLNVDKEYLSRLGYFWETVVCEGRRWLFIHAYKLPDGYTFNQTLLALEIPPTYPGAQIDMFYTFPPLALISGKAIECTQIRANIEGNEFHGWSRHRGSKSQWNPITDNIMTHLALVESALAKEVE